MSRAERVAARREYFQSVAEQIGSAGQAYLDYRLEKAEIRQEGKSERTEDRQEGRSERTEDKAAGGFYTPESTSARWDGYAALAESAIDLGALIATGGASGAIPDFSFGGSAEDGGYTLDDIIDMIPSGDGGGYEAAPSSGATATQGGERRSDSSGLGLMAALGAGLLLLK